MSDSLVFDPKDSRRETGVVWKGHKNDLYRPQYHFTAPCNWLNDPNGLIHWKGHYHLFYQHNPNGAFWGTMHWGHAMSDDLVHWKHMPIALTPSPDGPDADGCFSGVAVGVDGVATVLYTGVRGYKQLPCIAVSRDDDLSTWDKHPNNPVISAPPPNLDTTIFRDHSVWKEDDNWYQVIGSGVKDIGGTAFLYRSSDFVNWEFVDSLISLNSLSQRIGRGVTSWECPDFFEMNGQHVLIVSVWDQKPLSVNYFIGEYTNQEFTPTHEGAVDPGVNFYAPQSFTDEAGRRIMFGWVKEGRSAKAQLEAGWSGVMSLPRVLSILPDGSLGISPAPELKKLRTRHARFSQSDLGINGELPLGEIRGNALELLVTFDPSPAEAVEVDILCSQDGREKVTVSYDREHHLLILDTGRSSRAENVERGVYSLQHLSNIDSTLQLRIFVDHSIIEVFLNDEKCITARAYPESTDAPGVFVRPGGGLALASVDVWELGHA